MRVCSVQDCGRRHQAHGLCNMHFKRLRKHGDVSIVLRAPPRLNRSVKLECGCVYFALKQLHKKCASCDALDKRIVDYVRDRLDMDPLYAAVPRPRERERFAPERAGGA